MLRIKSSLLYYGLKFLENNPKLNFVVIITFVIVVVMGAVMTLRAGVFEWLSRRSHFVECLA
jgi:hypothetical protein